MCWCMIRLLRYFSILVATYCLLVLRHDSTVRLLGVYVTGIERRKQLWYKNKQKKDREWRVPNRKGKIQRLSL